MKLEEQVCSLELAKRLKELGMKQESLFWWHDDRFYGFSLKKEGEDFEGDAFRGRPEDGDISAFTVAELGEMLPIGYRSFKRWAKDDKDADLIVWRCESPIEHSIDQWPVEEVTEANVRAKYLAKLIESGRYGKHLLVSKQEAA